MKEDLLIRHWCTHICIYLPFSLSLLSGSVLDVVHFIGRMGGYGVEPFSLLCHEVMCVQHGKCAHS